MTGIAVVLDLLIVGLLCATISYAVILNRKLRRLRDAEVEMRHVIAEFNASTAKAESNLEAIKELAASVDAAASTRRDANETLRTLAPVVEQARSLATDLGLMVDRGEKAAAQLDAAPSRQRARPSPVPAAAVEDAVIEGGFETYAKRSLAARELASSLKGVR